MNKQAVQCPHCEGVEIVFDVATGEEICSNCGLVLKENNLNMGPERRSFSLSEDNSRSRTGLGISYVLFDKGLSTVFRGKKDGTGKALKNETLQTISRLRRYDNRSKVTESWRRNLSIAMGELDRMSDGLHLSSNTKERSAILYRKALKEDLIRGWSIDSFVAACIYAVCRQSGLPRPLKDISKVSKREHYEVASSYRLLIRELGLRMPVDDPIKYIPKIASELYVCLDTENRAIEILRLAKRLNGLSGKNPKGVAAAALYKACLENREKRSQKRVAEVAGTSEVTLRNRLRGLNSLYPNSDK